MIGSLEYKGHNYYGPWFAKITDVYDFGYEGEDVISAPFTAMVGPGEEFGVIGYDDVKPGGTFIKPGVGVLRRTDDTPYNHSKTYEIVDGGKWTVKQSGDSVEFTQTLNDPAAGYGSTLKNTGAWQIQSNVYDHNFLVLDNQAPGPDFEITFPFQLQARQAPNRQLGEIRGNQIAYQKTLEKQERMSTTVTGFSDSPKDYDIKVAGLEGCLISGTDAFRWLVGSPSSGTADGRRRWRAARRIRSLRSGTTPQWYP